MFDFFSWSHILVLLVVALVVVGPKDLPRLMHKAGKWARNTQQMATELRSSFDEMARHTELDEVRKEIEALSQNKLISDTINPTTAINGPLSHDGPSTSEETGVSKTTTAPAMAEKSKSYDGKSELTDQPSSSVGSLPPTPSLLGSS